MTGYEKEERKGRGYVQQLFPKHSWDYSPIHENLSWDVSGNTNNGEFLGEIKIRYSEAEAFETGFLEQYKFDALKEISKTNNDLPMVYFNIYNDKSLVYRLDLLPVESYETKMVWCPKSSSEELGGKWKPMILLPIKDASKVIEKGYNKMIDVTKGLC